MIKMKGQIFSLDSMFSMIIIVMILGIIAWEYETILGYSSYILDKNNYLFALSISDNAVKRFLVIRDFNNLNVPNKIDINSPNFTKTWEKFCNITKTMFNSTYMKFSQNFKGFEINLYKYDPNTKRFVPTQYTCDYYYTTDKNNAIILTQGKVCNANFPGYVRIIRPLINDHYIQAPLEGSGYYATDNDIYRLEVIVC